MQIKKKAATRSSTRDLACPTTSRHQIKLPEDVKGQEKKVSELITSSVRKNKLAGTQLKKSKENVDATNLNTRFGLVDDDISTCSLHSGNHTINHGSLDPKACDGTAPCVMGTIFSPAFHVSRNVEVEMSSGADFIKIFKDGDDQYQDCGKENAYVDLLNVHDLQEKNYSNSDQMTLISLSYPDSDGGLSSEVSAIYNSLKNSKLECVEEHDQDHMSTDVCMDDDECEDFDEFDPYYFIKNLPKLSAVVPTFRPVLLPKQTRSCPPTTLVLDLDETLVHSTLEPCNDADFTFSVNFNLTNHPVYVRCRPYLKDFMERVSGLFEIIIFTASQSIYAEQLLNVLDPKRKVFRHRVYRESCVYVDGNYLKDLSCLGRDLAHVIMIDNSPQAFGFQVENGIPIESWFDDRSDRELIALMPFLESLIGVEDVRPLIAKKFNLRQKIAAAVCPQSL